MKDKLKKIVEKMLEGGWMEYQSPKFDHVFKDDYGRISVCMSYDDDFGGGHIDYPVPTLFTSPDAMGALFGEGLVCAYDGYPFGFNRFSRQRCIWCDNKLGVKAIVYHGLKAAELLLTQGQQQSIEYIWKECGE